MDVYLPLDGLKNELVTGPNNASHVLNYSENRTEKYGLSIGFAHDLLFSGVGRSLNDYDSKLLPQMEGERKSERVHSRCVKLIT